MSKTLSDLLAGSVAVGSLKVTNAVLVAAAEAVAADREKQAVQACKGLLENFTSGMTRQVDALRTYRKQAKTQLETVRKLDRALQFFAATGNPLPVFMANNDTYGGTKWCKMAGIPVPKGDYPAWTVPADFTDSATVIDADAEPSN